MSPRAAGGGGATPKFHCSLPSIPTLPFPSLPSPPPHPDLDTSLNALMSKYEASGLSTLGTPCGDFANQEPGGNDEILAGLKYVRPGNGFVPAFPLMQKVRTLRTARAGGTEALREREGGRRLC